MFGNIGCTSLWSPKSSGQATNRRSTPLHSSFFAVFSTNEISPELFHLYTQTWIAVVWEKCTKSAIQPFSVVDVSFSIFNTHCSAGCVWVCEFVNRCMSANATLIPEQQFSACYSLTLQFHLGGIQRSCCRTHIRVWKVPSRQRDSNIWKSLFSICVDFLMELAIERYTGLWYRHSNLWSLIFDRNDNISSHSSVDNGNRGRERISKIRTSNWMAITVNMQNMICCREKNSAYHSRNRKRRIIFTLFQATANYNVRPMEIARFAACSTMPFFAPYVDFTRQFKYGQIESTESLAFFQTFSQFLSNHLNTALNYKENVTEKLSSVCTYERKTIRPFYVGIMHELWQWLVFLL